jgi:hypothetical protein
MCAKEGPKVPNADIEDGIGPHDPWWYSPAFLRRSAQATSGYFLKVLWPPPAGYDGGATQPAAQTPRHTADDERAAGQLRAGASPSMGDELPWELRDEGK